jgi:hypothetical protein
MMTQTHDTIYTESFEYHGHTMIERIRRQEGSIVRRDWIVFNTVEEAEIFFNETDCDSAVGSVLQ